MRPQKYIKPALIVLALAAAFLTTFYLNKQAILEQCSGKSETKAPDETSIKGDLFFWESITRNFASIH